MLPVPGTWIPTSRRKRETVQADSNFQAASPHTQRPFSLVVKLESRPGILINCPKSFRARVLQRKSQRVSGYPSLVRDSRRCWRHVWLPASFPFQKFESHWSSGRATPSFLAPTCTHSIQTGLRTVFFHRPLGVRVLSTLTSCRRRGRGGLIRHGAMGLWNCRPGCAPPDPPGRRVSLGGA